MWCPDRRGYGGPIHGSCADLILTDARNCLPLPPELSFASGAMMACNAGTAFSATSKLQISGLETVAIFGQGPVGLAGVIFAKALGGQVIAIEPIPERRQLALDLGADETFDPTEVDPIEAIRELTHNEGADCVFETSGSSPGREGAVACLRPGGRAVFVGFGSQDKTLNLSDIIGRQLTLMGSFVLPIHMYWDMAKFIVDRNLPLEAMITHRFSIDEGPQAFECFAGGQTGKVILEWA